jgi:hypothetical protein
MHGKMSGEPMDSLVFFDLFRGVVALVVITAFAWWLLRDSFSDLWIRWRLRRHRNRFGPGMCTRCGYDVRTTSGRCPECGEPVKTMQAPPRQLLKR